MNKVLLSGFKEINIEQIRKMFNYGNDLQEVDQQNGCVILTFSNSQIAQNVIVDWNDKEFDGNILTLQQVQLPQACYACGQHGHILRDSALKKTFKIRQNALIVGIQDIGNSIFYERAKDCYQNSNFDKK